jgi:hypothetical protein
MMQGGKNEYQKKKKEEIKQVKYSRNTVSIKQNPINEKKDRETN